MWLFVIDIRRHGHHKYCYTSKICRDKSPPRGTIIPRGMNSTYRKMAVWGKQYEERNNKQKTQNKTYFITKNECNQDYFS